MSTLRDEAESVNLRELQARRRVLLQELKDRSLWFVRVRWWVPPAIAAGIAGARLVGIQVAVWPLLCVAAFLLAANTFFLRWHRRFVHEPALQSEDQLRRFTQWQVAADYAAMFAFIHFTGGVSSPFVFFLIFHIIFASILLKHRVAHLFALGVSAALGLLAAAESLGWLPPRLLVVDGRPLILMPQPLPALVQWAIFSAAVLISCFATTNIMEMVRRRILKLAELSEAVMTLNSRLGGLHTISQSIVAQRRLEPVLQIACQELAKVMGVQAVSVKLLHEDGQRLRFAAAHGLPPQVVAAREIDLARSPLNSRLREGEPFVTGSVTQRELFQLGEELSAAHLRSVLLVPLKAGERMIGVLGAYAAAPDRFRRDDIDFFRLAGELVALALENARAYEAIENLMQERDRFMLRAAHNLRAPLTAMLAMLEVLSEGYLGQVNDAQRDYVGRLQRRARGLADLINELLLLAERQGRVRRADSVPVDLGGLLRRAQRTFQEEAQRRGLRLRVETAAATPPVAGDAALLERLVENLVSNALKYTPLGGEVALTLQPAPGGRVRLEVSDTGIGIPAEALPRLFGEFFRAENAKAIEEIGTGLGLAIVKEIAEQHGGQVSVRSREGRGSTFTVMLPAAAPAPAVSGSAPS